MAKIGQDTIIEESLGFRRTSWPFHYEGAWKFHGHTWKSSIDGLFGHGRFASSNHIKSPLNCLRTSAMATQHDQLWETSCGDSLAPMLGKIHVKADVHCKGLWWPNQEMIKIHDPFANLVFVGITSLNSTCGQQTLHPMRRKQDWAATETLILLESFGVFWTIMIILILQRQPQMINPKSGD